MAQKRDEQNILVKTFLSWEQVIDKLQQYDRPDESIYGIPRGGMLLAGFLQRSHNVYDPAIATMFLDDIIDSGKTREQYRIAYPNIPFHAIVDKTGPDKDVGWVVFPWEHETGPEDSIIRMLEYIGENPKREGLVDTPGRVVRSFDQLYRGYKQEPKEILSRSFDSQDYDEMIVLKDIDFFSMCEHHMLPFFGKAKVGYVPGPSGRVVGISKLARLVDCFARRLQIQERMTKQIAQAIQDVLQPVGVGVVVEAQHLCMKARGVEKQNSMMVTSCLLGAFRDKPEARQEFLSR